jgi:hypothetical protein
MKLDTYFETHQGIGVLSTADAEGRVNAAIYGRPHVLDEQTVAFIAADRLTRANLQANPSAVYLFKEEGVYTGKRLYLTSTREEKDSPLIDEIRRKKERAAGREGTGPRFLVYFRVDKVLPLTGGGE